MNTTYPTKKTDTYKAGVFYFTRERAEAVAALVGGTMEKTRIGYRVKTADGYLGPKD